MSTYAVRLPFPPSVNTYYRRAGHTIHLSKQGREFKELARAAIANDLGVFDPFNGRVGVSIELSCKDRRRYDVDNRVKAVLDVLETEQVILNDLQVDVLHVKRLPVDETGNGFADVIVLEL